MARRSPPGTQQGIRSFEELFRGGAVGMSDGLGPSALFEADFFGEGQPPSRSRSRSEGVDEDANLDLIPALDASIKQVTLYPRIKLGGESPAAPVTGVFIPKAFQPANQLDAILYLHGHHTGNGYPPELTISDYWDRAQHPLFRFREELNATQRSIILIAPTLGPGSQAGWLVESGGLDRYMELVRKELVAAGHGISASATWGNLVLACHSGGGSPMRRIANGDSKLAANISQCWGFDCLYSDGDVPSWLSWANQGSKRVYIYYGSGGTATRATKLLAEAKKQWLANLTVYVEGSTSLDHNKVPITYWRERISALP